MLAGATSGWKTGTPPIFAAEELIPMRDPRPALSAKALLLPVLLLVFALAAPPARAVRVGEIPSPRPTGWSVDLTGRVPRDVLARIDGVGERIKATRGAELAVVAVGTT